ncbi:Pleckstrin homology domain-containing protein [Melampsora americana]|nr:Pleckstrin homology domain-containing protein [Melampsora americana]
MGGGNWLSNAQPMGELSLTHSLSSALPSGYNRDRPCAFVLTLANESSYFFQAGTADLVNEWVSTCNYWSARLSKEPLTGGVSNMEYGWNQVADLAIRMSSLSRRSTDFKAEEEEEKVESQTRTKKLRQKIIKPNSSNIGSIYSLSGSDSVKGSVADLRLTNNPSQPLSSQPQINSNVMINDWSAPIPPNSISTLTEENQLENLRKHSIYMQTELEKHNYLRKPMMSLYPPRSMNFQKSTNNWEKKSQYLLAEIIKYTTYIDALESGIHQKNEKRSKRLVQSLLENADS